MKLKFWKKPKSAEQIIRQRDADAWGEKWGNKNFSELSNADKWDYIMDSWRLSKKYLSPASSPIAIQAIFDLLEILKDEFEVLRKKE